MFRIVHKLQGTRTTYGDDQDPDDGNEMLTMWLPPLVWTAVHAYEGSAQAHQTEGDETNEATTGDDARNDEVVCSE